MMAASCGPSIPGFTEFGSGVLVMAGHHCPNPKLLLRTTIFVLESGKLLLLNVGSFAETAVDTWQWLVANRGSFDALLVANDEHIAYAKSTKVAMRVPIWCSPAAKSKVPCDFVFGESTPPWAGEFSFFTYPSGSSWEYAFFHKRSKIFVTTGRQLLYCGKLAFQAFGMPNPLSLADIARLQSYGIEFAIDGHWDRHYSKTEFMALLEAAKSDCVSD